MSLWIKICGNTSLGDAMLAAEAGADAVGFVFAPSPRNVALEQVAAIVPHLPPALEKVGVFVEASFNEVTYAVESCGLTGVQLHFGAPRDLPIRLRARLGSRVRILRVVYFDGGGATAAFNPKSASSVDAILIDSHTTYAPGGTGIPFDWTAARPIFDQFSKERKLVAAGGLNPENVARAISILQPWGVDVVSGVEASPGRKDAAKLRSFIANARAATQDRGNS
jgi:phosphoribosylanthranilate isomerase